MTAPQPRRRDVGKQGTQWAARQHGTSDPVEIDDRLEMIRVVLTGRAFDYAMAHGLSHTGVVQAAIEAARDPEMIRQHPAECRAVTARIAGRRRQSDTSRIAPLR